MALQVSKICPTLQIETQNFATVNILRIKMFFLTVPCKMQLNRTTPIRKEVRHQVFQVDILFLGLGLKIS